MVPAKEKQPHHLVVSDSVRSQGDYEEDHMKGFLTYKEAYDYVAEKFGTGILLKRMGIQILPTPKTEEK